MKKMRALLLTASAMLLAASCQLRPLCDPSEAVMIKVTVDTDGISNVTCDLYNPYISYETISTDMIRCMFYDPETGNLLSQSFIENKSYNAKGQEVLSGTVNILSGNFDIICYSFDTPNTLVRDESAFSTIDAFSTEVSSSVVSRFSPLKADVPTVYNTPDHLVVSRDLNYKVALHSELTTIETTARTCIDTYYLQIHAKNANRAGAINAVLTGLSGDNKFALDERNANPSMAYFDLQVSKDDQRYGNEDNAVICAVFNTFGKIEASNSQLHIYATTTSGKVVEKTYSMDEIFATADAQNHHWLFIDEEFEFPQEDDPKPGGGGFNPEVSEWEEEHGEITL